MSIDSAGTRNIGNNSIISFGESFNKTHEVPSLLKIEEENRDCFITKSNYYVHNRKFDEKEMPLEKYWNDFTHKEVAEKRTNEEI